MFALSLFLRRHFDDLLFYKGGEDHREKNIRVPRTEITTIFQCYSEMEGLKNKGVTTGAILLLLSLVVTSSLLVSTANASDGEACCDSCICTRSLPPQCLCADVKSYCSPTCENCVCTKSIPPQCSCTDFGKDHCDPPCSSSTFRFQQVFSG